MPVHRCSKLQVSEGAIVCIHVSALSDTRRCKENDCKQTSLHSAEFINFEF